MLLSWGLSARYVSWCLCPSGHRLVSGYRCTSSNIGRQRLIVTTYDSCVIWQKLSGPAHESFNGCSICCQHICSAKLSVHHIPYLYLSVTLAVCLPVQQLTRPVLCIHVTVEHLVLEHIYLIGAVIALGLTLTVLQQMHPKASVCYHVPNLFWLACE